MNIIDSFHHTTQNLDFLTSLKALLSEFNQGNIADKSRTHENTAIQTHLANLNAAWDQTFPPFPRGPRKRRTLMTELCRGRRDAYLKQLIETCVPGHHDQPGTRLKTSVAPASCWCNSRSGIDSNLIVNPVCVIGRHARDLARRLPDYRILATDINPLGERLYRIATFWNPRRLPNYRFKTESIFEPDLTPAPSAVVFFGACGSLTDAAHDYAIAVNSPFLICRSCCHENIAANTNIVRRPTVVNWFFSWKNWGFARAKRKNNGFYFNPRYAESAYPRSAAARELLTPAAILAIAQNSPDSDICRTIIDLDRCLYLKQNGYDINYKEELFFAHRRHNP